MTIEKRNNFKLIKMRLLLFFLSLFIALGCNSKDNASLNDFKIHGTPTLLQDLKIKAEVILKNNTKKKILLYEDGNVLKAPKDVLRYEFEINYNDSIYAHYGSDNKIKAGTNYKTYHFYIFKKDSLICVNIDFTSENKTYDTNFIILKP